MPVKVFIQQRGDKMGGSFEIAAWPPQVQDGFIHCVRLVKKDGSRKEMIIAVNNIDRIEKAVGGQVYGAINPDELPEEIEE